MKKTGLILLFGLVAFSQAPDTKDFVPLPEVYALKLQVQEKERAIRDGKLAEIRQYMMADIEKAEQDIATQACKEVLGVELKDCQMGNQGQGLVIGLRPGVKKPEVKPEAKKK